MNTITIRPFAAVKFAVLAALGLAMLLLSGCHWVGVKGNGNIKTETRPIEAFTKVQADGAFEITWAAAPAGALSITTDENLMEYMRTTLSGETLKVEWIKPLKGTRGIKVNIASPTLSGVNLNGAVRLVASGLSGPELVIEANGATRIALEGNVNAMAADLNGASRLDAESLEARAIELSISGAGKAEVNATQVLKVTVSGAGKVTYLGNPQVTKEINGAGSVKRRDE